MWFWAKGTTSSGYAINGGSPNTRVNRLLETAHDIIEIDELDFKNEIGKGNDGAVYAGTYNDGPCAIKQVGANAKEIVSFFYLFGNKFL